MKTIRVCRSLCAILCFAILAAHAPATPAAVLAGTMPGAATSTAPLPSPSPSPGQAALKFSRMCEAYLQFGAKTAYTTRAMSLGYIPWDFALAKYVDDAELATKRIESDPRSGAWIYSQSGRLVGSGEYLFVMDGQGSIMIETEELSLRRVYHSSMLSRVAAAGILNFGTQSEILKVTDQTGHFYRGFSRGEMIEQLKSELARRGLDLNSIEFQKVLMD